MRTNLISSLITIAVAGMLSSHLSAGTDSDGHGPAGTSLPGAAVTTETAVKEAGIIEGSMTCTTRDPGHWSVFVNAAGARILQANKDSIWFLMGEGLCRYNVETRAIDVQTSILTHCAIRGGSGPTALAADGRFVISGYSDSYLWTPDKGWSRLPQTPEQNPPAMGFDSAGRLWAFGFGRAYQWDKDCWGQSVPGPKWNYFLFPCGDGWFYSNYAWIPVSLDQKKAVVLPQTSAMVVQRYKAGDKVLALAQTGKGQSLCLVTPKDMQMLVEGPMLGLDLATGDVFKCTASEDSSTITVLTPDGTRLTDFPTPPNAQGGWFCLLRDANGHYWSGNLRWDGKKWEPIMPPGAFYFPGGVKEAILAGRLCYDEGRKTWIDAWPQVPAAVAAYDLKTRRGWLRKNPNEYSKPAIWEQFEFAQDGSKKLLQTVTIEPSRSIPPAPTFEDSKGNWWFGSDRRWDGKNFHLYDDGSAARTVSSYEQGNPFLFLSTKGTIWMCQVRHTWKRYDRDADAFVEDSPFGEYATTVGEKTFAAIGRQADYQDSAPCGIVYAKGTAGWERFTSPFADTEPGHTWRFGSANFWASLTRGARDNRMLLSTGEGVLEWDVKADRWAYLTPYSGDVAIFDEKGRVVCAGMDRIIMYEGDPFEKGKPSGGDLQARMDQLLNEMDDNSWRIRQLATADMSNLFRKNPAVVRKYLSAKLADAKPSLEVEARVKTVLDEQLPAGAASWTSPQAAKLKWRSKVGNSILERASRPMVAAFPDGYVIKPGMRYELAQSILDAAGAKYSSEVHNAHYPDYSYKGYLLPDGSMVYLRLDCKPTADFNAPIKILSIGLGVHGAGNDPNWPWTDQSKNSLPSLELKPNYSTRN